jgi:glycosyltransferase involved in cell wall biosynthesis
MSIESLTVIICTHNPREDYLGRVLEALSRQTLSTSRWELLIVDNASSRPVAETVFISWHPNARILREEKAGLTHARFRGGREARGEVIVFLDDDNVPDADYLERGLSMFAANPMIGCVSGHIRGEYETPPPSWFTGEYESWLAVRSVSQDRFSNFWHPRSEPCGAGMVVRRSVLISLIREGKATEGGLVMDRSGASLLSGGDVEISHHAMDMGYLVGQVAELKLTHLISSRRAGEEYLFRLYRNICASGQIIASKRAFFSPFKALLRQLPKELAKMILKPHPERRMAFERIRSYFLARRLLRDGFRSTQS